MKNVKKIASKISKVGNNFPDIIEWCKVRRPDCIHHLQNLKGNDAVMLVMSIAYQAGRASVVAEIDGIPMSEAAK